jgi:tetratricopeptide (TPR) repeat protein
VERHESLVEKSELANTTKHFARTYARHSLASRAWEWSTAHGGAIFAVISACWVVLLYRGAIHAPFVYDDIDQVQKNVSIQRMGTTWHYFHSAEHFSDSFRGFGGSFYRPLFWFSLAIDHKVWGLNPTGFHVTNIALHWITGMLGFFVLRRLRASVFVSAGSSLLWLGLPINSEVVAWVSGRTYSLMVLFLFLALLSAEWYLRSPRTLPLLSYCLAALATTLCHEEGVLVLPLTLLVLYSVDRFRSRRKYGVIGVAGISALGAYFSLRQVAGTQISTALSSESLSGGVYFIKYLNWMVLPIRMSVERSTDVPANSLSILTIGAWIAVAVLLLLAYRLRKQLPEMAAGITWIGIALLPFCGIISIYQGMAERYDYLASGGLCFLIIAFLSQLRARRAVISCAVAIWAFWGAWRLEKRVLDWRDPIALYKASLEATPQSSALLFDLGAAFEQKGDLVQAAAYYEHTLDVDSQYEKAIAGVGSIYLRRGAPAEAKSAFERALTLNPRDVTALVNYGAALLKSGDVIDAKLQEEKAISINPADAGAYCNLAVVLVQLGAIDDAIENLLRAVDLDPSRTTAYFDLAALYRYQGHIDSAAAMYRKILEVSPNDPEAVLGLREITR